MNRIQNGQLVLSGQEGYFVSTLSEKQIAECVSLLSEIFPASCRLKSTEEVASQIRFVIRCICLSPFKKIDVSVEEERVFRKFVADKKGVTFY